MKRKANHKAVLEKKALYWRSQWGYGNSEPIYLKTLLLEIGVLALFRPMSEAFSGMAVKIQEESEALRFIMVNSNKSIGHQNFTICHELYHLYAQDKFESKVCSVGVFDRKDIEEYNADIFASYLLMPDDAITSRVSEFEILHGDVSLGTILKLENSFFCSRRFLLIRLKDMGLISEDSFVEYQKGVKESARSYGYGPFLYEASAGDSVVGNYGALAHDLLNKEIISENHFYTLMAAIGVPIDSIELTPDEIS
ncbi:MAG: ImmA/IrrE family metallo-endopeptidase [Dyadobacter fermentans]